MKPYWQADGVTLYCATVEEWAREYEGENLHALLADPPYHLTSITKRFGCADAQPAKDRTGGPFASVHTGFMGQQWDGGDVAFRPETWAGFLPHLHPGAFGFAFSGTRGWHRQAVAIEDAGFVFHPTVFLLGWVNGSSFPKATRIDTQIDAEAGAERETIPNPLASKQTVALGRGASISVAGGDKKHNTHLSLPETPLARAWAGHRYGMQALKSSLEPCLCFQVPYTGRPVDCITRTGAGALNVDAGRVAADGDVIKQSGVLVDLPRGVCADGYDRPNATMFRTGKPRERSGPAVPAGRWPSNVCLVHEPSCTPDACAEGCAVRILGEQSGESVTPASVVQGRRSTANVPFGSDCLREVASYADSGTAARFFHQSDWALEVQEQIAGAVPWFYAAKSSRAERDAGLEGFPLRDASKMSGGEETRQDRIERGLTNHPQARNPHPTVKPLDLCRHLATLLSPPAAYAPRRLLVVFAGVGSEVCGAVLSGQWEEIVAVEMSEEYCEIAAARIAYWQKVAAEERAREAERAAQPCLPMEPAPARREKVKQPVLWEEGGKW